VASLRAFSISAAIALLAGCGGLQPPIVAPGTMPQSHAIAQHPARGKSWMAPGVKGRNLLYVSAGSHVNVYSYPQGAIVGVLSGFEGTRGECVDKAGDVFIVDTYAGIFEYAHGGTIPVVVLTPPFEFNLGCSSDPTTGSLAVSGGDGSVIVFPYRPKQGWRYPKMYGDPAISRWFYCAYDSSGNLFADGINKNTGAFALAELPKGNKTFTNITLDQSIGTAHGSPSVVYQFTISGSDGTEVGSTTLGGAKHLEQWWIQGKKFIGPNVHKNNVYIGFWKYPTGMRNKKITNVYSDGLTVSLAPH
jgi:hypothetical protein